MIHTNELDLSYEVSLVRFGMIIRDIIEGDCWWGSITVVRNSDPGIRLVVNKQKFWLKIWKLLRGLEVFNLIRIAFIVDHNELCWNLLISLIGYYFMDYFFNLNFKLITVVYETLEFWVDIDSVGANWCCFYAINC